ncbi:hypothetical protein J4212_08150 [Candidatus Woesearchaeota archaeon]|nr:hypothetical protein [Candidatus Woesearchaeota archaeon]
MATFLDVAALQNFSQIFVFLFVWLGGYGVLMYSRTLGGNQFLNILIPLILAIFVVSSELATQIIVKIIPWLVIVMVFVMILAAAGGAFGGNFEAFGGGTKTLLLVVVALFIVIGAGVQVRQSITVPGDNETSTDFSRDYSQTATILFHPTMLGILFLLALAVFTIALLAGGGMGGH